MQASTNIISAPTAFPSSSFAKFSGLLSLDFDAAPLTGDCVLASSNAMSDINFAATQITSFTADFLPSITNFLRLHLNNNIRSVSLASITSIGTLAAYGCNLLQTISMPNLQSTPTGDLAIYDNPVLLNINFPSLKTIFGRLAGYRSGIQSVSLPELTNTAGPVKADLNLFNNPSLTVISMPKLTVLASNGELVINGCPQLTSIDLRSLPTLFLNFNIGNTKVNYLNLDSLTTVGGSLGLVNTKLTSLNFPSLISVAGSFSFANSPITSINLPQFTSALTFVFSNTQITRMNLPLLTTVSLQISGINSLIQSFSAPLLNTVGSFDMNGTPLNDLNLDSLETITVGFNIYNTKVVNLRLPSLTSINNFYIYNCNLLETIDIPLLVAYSGDTFSFSLTNSNLSTLNMPSLTTSSQINFSQNKLTSVNLASLQTATSNILLYSNQLTSLSLPNLQTSLLIDFSSNPNLSSFSAPLLTSVDGFNTKDNNKLTTINLDSLTTSTASIDVSYNDLLDLHLPSLTSINGDLIFAGNLNLQSIYAPLLTTMTGDIDLNYSLLQSVDFKSLTTCDNIYLHDNQLQSVDFSELTSTGEIYLFSNKLSSLSFPKLTLCDEIIVDRNPLLLYFSAGLLGQVINDIVIYNGNLQTLLLPSLSLVKGLYAQGNQIDNIDLSLLFQVTGGDLDLSSNQIITLNLPLLQSISNIFNIQLNDKLQVLNTPNLASISGGVELLSSALTSVDLGSLLETDFIHLNDNPLLLSVDLTALMQVHGDINIYSTSITSLVMNDLVLCEGGITIYNNKLITFEIPLLTEIKGALSLYNNMITTLNLPQLQTVDGIYATNNDISTIDLTGLITVNGDIEIIGNQITSLNFPNLVTVSGTINSRFGNNGLSTVTAPLLNTVGSIIIYDSSLPSLSLPITSVAQSIELSYNTLLLSVDLSNLVDTSNIAINFNSVTSIDLSSLQYVYGDLDLRANQMTSLNLNSLLEVQGPFDLSDNLLLSSFTAPSWAIANNVVITKTQISSLSFPSLTTAVNILIHSNSLLTSLSLPSLDSSIIFARSNALTSVDLSSLVNCGDLDLSHNQLTTVNVDQLVRLFGTADLTFNPDLSSFTAPLLLLTSGISITGSKITSLLLDSLNSGGNILINGNPLLTSASFSSLVDVNIFDLSSNALTSLNLPILTHSMYNFDVSSNQLINLNLPQLGEVGNNDFSIQGNPTLISINAPVLKNVTEISLPNGVLQTVNFNLLSNCSLLDFSHNQITSIDLSSLLTIAPISMRRSLIVGLDLSFNLLTSLQLDQLISITSGDLDLSNNPSLTTLSLPLLQFADNIIVHNTNVNSIVLQSLSLVNNLDLQSNSNLNTIRANVLTAANEILIEGNGALSVVSFNTLQTITQTFSIISSSLSTPLSFSQLTSVGSLQINNNDFLPDLLLLNGISVGFPIDLQNNQLTTVPNFLYQITTRINEVDISNNKFNCGDLPAWCATLGANCFPCVGGPTLTASFSSSRSLSPSFTSSPSPSPSHPPLVFLGPDAYSLPPVPSSPPLFSSTGINIGVVGNGIEGGNYYSPSNTFLQSEPISVNGGRIDIDGFGYITYNANAFSTSIDSLLVISLTSPSLVGASDFRNSENKTAVIDFSLVGPAYLISSLNICFYTDLSSTTDKCLGYIDESVDPPTWKCEDRCLQTKDSKTSTNSAAMCGKTSHLTSFAVLFEGIANNGGECEDNKDYILGSYDYDLILSASVAGFVILLAIIFLIAICFTPLHKYAMGKEGHRIYSIRRETAASILAANNTQLEI